MRASNENRLTQTPRLAGLTSWDADWSGLRVVVAGIGVSGFAAADTLVELGARVVVVDSATGEAVEAKAETLRIVGAAEVVLGPEAYSALPEVEGEPAELLVTSPGFAPHHELIRAAEAAGVPIWGDVELAWRVRERAGRKTAEWVCITGTNGKTTTVGMTESILQAGGLKAIAVGNVGTPILDALRDPVEYDVLAVELSSFQLHWTHSLSPLASVVLNLAQDHVDWHEGFENYQADKARVYENTKVACVYNVEQPETEAMVAEAEVVEGCRAIGFTTGVPAISMLGVAEDLLVDRAFLAERATQALELAAVTDTGDPVTRHGVSNALAAAALARAAGVAPEAVAAGLQAYEPGDHRIQKVARLHEVLWINDSKATNPHATHASLSSFEPVVWIAGGLSKGVDYRDLVERHRERLRTVVLIGTDTDGLRAALAELAPAVPVLEATSAQDPADGDTTMDRAVDLAHGAARPGDTVLMAPAAASMDQFVSYAHRGNSFVRAVTALAERLS